jgi:4-hydroxybutyrate dehydrogenase/sulfolactaldehyde 3-reductase
METIGFIGLGRMGRPMASNLRKKGFELVVYDVNPEPVRVLEALGARAANGVAGIAQASDVVITMLPSSVEVEATMLSADGVLANGRPGQIVMDMSTVEPQTTDRLAAAAAARGLSVVDAPVARLAAHADRGESLFMVGASDADFQRVLPHAAMYDHPPLRKVGSGIRTKLVNNYLAIVSCQLNAEALFCRNAGLDLPKTLEVLYGTTATNGQLRVNAEQGAGRRYDAGLHH